MNEYQDQEVWYRLAVESDDAEGYEIIGDYDSRDDAQHVFNTQFAGLGLKFMITRKYGIAVSHGTYLDATHPF